MHTPKNIFNAPVITQIILFFTNTLIVLFIDSQNRYGLVIVLSMFATAIIMHRVDSNINEWLSGTLVYISGKVLIFIFMFLRHIGYGLPREDFFLILNIIFLTAFIFGTQFVIWCITKSIKNNKSKFE